MQSFKKYMVVLLAAAWIAVPVAASAQTTDAQSQIQTLLQQIQALQQQLKALVASSTMNMHGEGMNSGQMGKAACISLSRNLRRGDQGNDVRDLQQMLSDDDENDDFASDSVTGFFGPKTMKAMMKFQMKMGIASSTDGSVGRLTRGFFERRCGKGLDGNRGPGNGGGSGGDMMRGGGSISGTVTENSGTSIKVQKDGMTVSVLITSTTTVKIFTSTSTPPSNGSWADIAVGKMVRVKGIKNADGSIQAISIAVGTTLPPEDRGMENEHGMEDNHGMMNMMPSMNSGSMPPKPPQSGSIVPHEGGENHGGGNSGQGNSGGN